MCGKDIYLVVNFFWLLGSPPHVRERLDTEQIKYWAPRITPACAGKTKPEQVP